LLPPGSRKDNPYWLVRGTLADGRHIEATSKTTDLDAAKAFARDVAAGHSQAEAWRRLAARQRE